MRHRILTCKNHPDLRWSVKEVAWTVRDDGSGYYNGARNLGFRGRPTGEGMFSDGSGLYCSLISADFQIAEECMCGTDDLILAPEDALVKC